MNIQKLINKQHAEIAKLEAELKRLRAKPLYTVAAVTINARAQDQVRRELNLRKEFVNDLEGLTK